MNDNKNLFENLMDYLNEDTNVDLDDIEPMNMNQDTNVEPINIDQDDDVIFIKYERAPKKEEKNKNNIKKNKNNIKKKVITLNEYRLRTKLNKIKKEQRKNMKKIKTDNKKSLKKTYSF